MKKRFRKTLTKKQKIGLISLAGIGSIFITFIVLFAFPSLAQNISPVLGVSGTLWRAIVLLIYTCLSIFILLVGIIFNGTTEGSSKGNKSLRLIIELILIIFAFCVVIALNRIVLFLSFSLLPINLLLNIYALIVWGVQSFLTVFLWGWYPFKFKRVNE